MKRNVTISLTLFFLSVFINNFNRAFSSDELINPFIFEKEIEISIAWYSKHICELVSFCLLMLCVCYVLKPVEKHLMEVEWPGHNSILTFVKVWHRIFWVVAVTAILDVVNYFLTYKRCQEFFLLQNAIFLIMTGYYLFKAYKK
jgi:hypothetical protein